MSFSAQRAEICAGNREIHRVINRRPVFLRPPGGALDDDTIRAAKKCGISRIVLWNVVADYQQIVQARPGPTLKAGDIVLLHYLDSLPRSLDLVMRAAKKAGLRPALLRDYLLPAQTAETPTT
jgi:peptidoglycan/xylan/chitin deacetylase (PgdA/CDA1 family)